MYFNQLPLALCKNVLDELFVQEKYSILMPTMSHLFIPIHDEVRLDLVELWVII